MRGRLLLAGLLLVVGCAARAPLPTAPAVDLDRYTGTWFEIARLPNWFQRGCTHTTATYLRRADGRLTVINRCRRDGSIAVVEGEAWPADPDSNAKLLVEFFWPFRGDYWILAVAPDYRWALVGEPSREYLWILSRTPTLDPATYESLADQARALGYDVARLTRTPQNGATRGAP